MPMQAASPQSTNLPRPRWLRPLAWLTLILGVVVLVWMLFDWNWFKHPIEREVSALTGRPFRIEGNLGVRLSRTPLITADRIMLGNLPGAKDPEMLRIKRLAFRL